MCRTDPTLTIKQSRKLNKFSTLTKKKLKIFSWNDIESLKKLVYVRGKALQQEAEIVKKKKEGKTWIFHH